MRRNRRHRSGCRKSPRRRSRSWRRGRCSRHCRNGRRRCGLQPHDGKHPWSGQCMHLSIDQRDGCHRRQRLWRRRRGNNWRARDRRDRRNGRLLFLRGLLRHRRVRRVRAQHNLFPHAPGLHRGRNHNHRNTGQHHHRRERPLDSLGHDHPPLQNAFQTFLRAPRLRHGYPLPFRALRHRIQILEKSQQNFRILRRLRAGRERRLIARFFRKFRQAVAQPPGQRTEPKNRAMQQRHPFRQRIPPRDVRNLMHHYRVQGIGVPAAPIRRKQHHRIQHAARERNSQPLRLRQSWHRMQPRRACMRFKSCGGVCLRDRPRSHSKSAR